MTRVDLLCDVFSPSGYSAHAREVIRALHPLVDLKIINHKHDRMEVRVPHEEMLILQALAGKSRKGQVQIQFETPEFFNPKPDMLNIGFTQWETTRIPDTDLKEEPRNNWVKQMNRMDEMWTSCSFAQQVFSQCKVEKKTSVILGPVDTDRFVPGLLELPLKNLTVVGDRFVAREQRPFVVGMMAQWTVRKNIEAFLTTMFSRFKRGEVVVLLKTYGSTMSSEEGRAVEEAVRRIIARVNNPERPEIVLITQMLTDDEIARFFSSVDAYVNTSRGEGFCLPLTQAMSSQCVPITNAFSAPADYVQECPEAAKLDGENGYLVPYQTAPAVGMLSPWYRFDQSWGDISCDALAGKIRLAMEAKAERPDFWNALKNNARQTIVDRMSHQATGQRMKALIEEALARK